MKYFATVKRPSSAGYWNKLQSRTLIGAKREATHLLSGDFHGSVIHLVEVETPEDRERINDLVPWTKAIPSGRWRTHGK